MAWNQPTERFNHVHLSQEHPFCAQLWYQKHLNAPVFAGRTSPTPLTEAACKVKRGPSEAVRGHMDLGGNLSCRVHLYLCGRSI
jgi:hypothetical protein